MKNIAILSSGTDNSGINAAIRSIVRSASSMKMKIYGVNWGYRGLIDNSIHCLTSRDVSGKIGKAGCFLGTGRPEGCFVPENIPKMMETIKKNNIHGLIVIGGRTSLIHSQKFVDMGIPVIGIPSTIQDDIVGTDICLGVDSAVNNIVKYVDKIRSCEFSRDRTFIVQVEGKTCGSLALRSAIACGAEICLVPEQPCDDISVIARDLADASMTGKTQVLTMVSSGWKPGVKALSDYLVEHMEETDLLVRETVLGYVQRGGSPTSYDRLLGLRMGFEAVKAISEKESGKMIGLRNNEFLRVPFSEFLANDKPMDKALMNLFHLSR